MTYRVDQIPLVLRLPYSLFAYGLAVPFFLAVKAIGCTLRVSEEGRERLPSGPCIFVMWHTENVPAFVTSFFRRNGSRFVLLNHPAWYMKPTHILLRWLGVERLALGSSGNGGREAAKIVVEELRRGYGTHINPDGPSGPPLQLKKGALHLAAQSGVPLVAVRFICETQFVLTKSWDRKRLPLPFSRVRIVYQAPQYVTPDEMESAAARLQALL